MDDGFDVRNLKVGPPDAPPAVARNSRFRAGWIAPVTRHGTCEVFVSVGRRDGTPQLALPLAGDDGARRYAVGRLALRE